MKQQAKSIVEQTYIFLSVAFATLAISLAGLLFVAPAAHAADCDTQGGSDLTISGGVNCAHGNQQPTQLFGQEGIFTTVTNVLLFLIGAVSVIMLIIGGIRYTISNGDQGAITSAKNTILYAIIGLVIAILAYAAVNFVTTQFAAQQ